MGSASVAMESTTAADTSGYNLAPGETLVPGSVKVVGESAPVESASDAAPTPEAESTEAKTDEAPPAPKAEASDDSADI